MIEENEVPENWNVKRLSDVADVIIGNSPPGETYNQNGDGPLFIQGASVFGEIHPITDRYTSEPTKMCEEGDTIIAIRATIGDLNVADNEYCLGRGVAAVRARDKILQEFVHMYLESVNRSNYWREVATGATFNSITKTNIQNLDIPVPPLDEQERIVEVVEERLDRIERLEKSVDNISRFSEEYRDSYIAFLSSGLSSDSDKPVNGIPDDSELPDDWDLVSITDIGDVNPRIDTKESDDYAYVPMDAVSAETQEVERFDRRDSTYSSLATFQEGDILFARITPCFENGKIAVVPELPDGYDYAVGSSEFAVIRPKGVRTDYLHMYLTSPVIGEWGTHRLTGATGRERIRVGEIKNELYVPLPPESEQERIVKEVKKTNFNNIRISVNVLEDRFEEYRNSVLAHAFEGEY